MPDEPLLTTAEAARLLGISRRTLSRYALERQLVPTIVLPSGHYRWEIADIRRQLRDLRERTGGE